MKHCIDLNADLGEGYDDAQIMPYISSCNIACGGHVGDRETMARAIMLAQDHGVAIGAHPSYPDKDGFGRRTLTFNPDDLHQSLQQQLATFQAVAKAQGAEVHHVKPHGALYNDAVPSLVLADIILSASTSVFPKAVLVGAPFGSLMDTAHEKGSAYRREGFADRQYKKDGSLMPRNEVGAVIEDSQRQAAQALNLALGRGVISDDGAHVPLSVETICLHGDTEGALSSAQMIAEHFAAHSIAIKVPI